MKHKKRTSLIWQVALDDFKSIVKSSQSLSDILRKCGMKPRGANNLTLKRRLHEESIDYSHIILGRGATFKRGFIFRPKGQSLEDCMKYVFVKNGSDSKGSVRRYLRRFNLIKEECRDCGLSKLWNGKPLTLQLEHISGDPSDDRLENLCWLCPNCHSQTETYTGKSNRKK